MIAKFNAPTALMASLLTGGFFAISSANAAPEIIVNPATTSSTTVVEQYSDGKVATITATPNSITMQDGMPFSVTQVTTVPRYTIHQDATVVTTPVSTGAQVLAVSNDVPTTITLDSLQLNPTFSTPDVVNAQTKVMKILKNSDGREFAVPANNIAPGDTIEYHTLYTNNSAQPVRDINATVSLPNGVKLVSLNSPLTTMATVGGNSYQTIQQVGNSVAIQENYSGLKWNLTNLATNAPQTVVIRAKVQ